MSGYIRFYSVSVNHPRTRLWSGWCDVTDSPVPPAESWTPAEERAAKALTDEKLNELSASIGETLLGQLATEVLRLRAENAEMRRTHPRFAKVHPNDSSFVLPWNTEDSDV